MEGLGVRGFTSPRRKVWRKKAGFCGQVTLKKVLEALDAKRIELLDIVRHLEKAAQSLDLVVQPRTAEGCHGAHTQCSIHATI